MKPMALAVCWGITYSTAVTLLVIPCVYLIAEEIKSGTKKFLKSLFRPGRAAERAGQNQTGKKEMFDFKEDLI